jgi:hypothetical protein
MNRIVNRAGTCRGVLGSYLQACHGQTPPPALGQTGPAGPAKRIRTAWPAFISANRWNQATVVDRSESMSRVAKRSFRRPSGLARCISGFRDLRTGSRAQLTQLTDIAPSGPQWLHEVVLHLTGRHCNTDVSRAG